MNLLLECACGEKQRLPWFWLSKQRDLNCKGCQKLLLDGKPAEPSNPGAEKSKVGRTLKTPKACPVCNHPVAKNAVICLECGLEFASGKTIYSQDSSATHNAEDAAPIANVKKRPRRATTLQGICLTRGLAEKKFVALGFLLGFISLLGFGFVNSSARGASADALAALCLIVSVVFPVAGLLGTRTTFSARLERGVVLIEIVNTLVGYPFRSETIDITDCEVVRTYEYDRMFSLRSVLMSLLALCLLPLFLYNQGTALRGLLYETVRAVSIAGRFCNPVIVCDQIRSKDEARLISRLISVVTRLPERGGRKKS